MSIEQVKELIKIALQRIGENEYLAEPLHEALAALKQPEPSEKVEQCIACQLEREYDFINIIKDLEQEIKRLKEENDRLWEVIDLLKDNYTQGGENKIETAYFECILKSKKEQALKENHGKD